MKKFAHGASNMFVLCKGEICLARSLWCHKGVVPLNICVWLHALTMDSSPLVQPMEVDGKADKGSKAVAELLPACYYHGGDEILYFSNTEAQLQEHPSINNVSIKSVNFWDLFGKPLSKTKSFQKLVEELPKPHESFLSFLTEANSGCLLLSIQPIFFE